jgi:peptide/nickel transport system substrate-binding protein
MHGVMSALRPLAFITAWLILATNAADPSKVLRLGIKAAESGFDPVMITDAVTHGIVENIFDAPLTYDYLARPVKIVPNTLAEMPLVEGNGTIYTMRVKPGTYFQIPSGGQDIFGGRKRELTAYDYVYSIKRVFDPRRRSPNLYRIEGNIVGMDEILARARKENRFDYDTEVEGLRVLDRYRFQIKLKRPDHNFIYNLSLCIMSCAVAREVVEFYGDKVGEHPVGTGAYMLTFWRPSSKMVFEANPSYREHYYTASPATGDEESNAILAANKGKRVPIAGRVELYVIEQQQPRYLAFLNGEIDLLDDLPNEFANVVIPGNELSNQLRKRGVRMQRTRLNEVTYSCFGMRDPVVGGYAAERVALRRAINLGLDIDSEIRIVRKNQAEPAHSPIGPDAFGYDPNFRSSATEYDPARAKALLDMYGYVDCDKDGYRDLPRTGPAAPCIPLTIEYSSAPTAGQNALDENWKRSMEAIGIRMVFRKITFQDLLKESRAGKLQMWQLAWAPGIPDALAFFATLYGPSAGQANHARFSSREFDRLYDHARLLPQGPERNATYREMTRIFLVYAPWRLGVHRVLTDLSHPWAIGFRRHPMLGGFWKYIDIHRTKVETARK